MGRVLRAYQRAGIGRVVRPLLRGRLAEAERLLPRLSGRFFRPEEAPGRGEAGPRAALFAGCVMRLMLAGR